MKHKVRLTIIDKKLYPELQPVSFEIFMSAFNTLGKAFSAKRKWTMVCW